jgi:hypothetical protein
MNLPQLCCTGRCDVAGFEAPVHMQAMDAANTSVGVTWVTMGTPSDSADEFQWCVAQGQRQAAHSTERACVRAAHIHPTRSPIDPNTGYPVQRRVLHKMFCNPTGLATDPLVVNSVSDNATCAYVVSMTHKLGCGAPTPCKLDGF